MDERDAAAARRWVLRTMAGLWVYCVVLLLPSMVFDGISRAETAVTAGAALLVAGFSHIIRRVARRGWSASRGPLAGLGPADMEEVVRAVRQGRAVSDARLARTAVEHAQQRLGWTSAGRFLFPMVMALAFVNLFSNAHGRVGARGGQVITIVPLGVLWLVSLVSHRRASQSESANARLVHGGAPV